MVNQLPKSTEADAKSRAFRTLVQGFLLDILATVLVAVVAQLTDIRWTKEYWIGIAVLAGKTAVMAIVSYIARKKFPPATT